ncbi:hypothetical protein Ddc_21639 [Ditylenchus destructor]|nr:hypothetical protein Ddc_21639 [Ditylenchus destructor]
MMKIHDENPDYHESGSQRMDHPESGLLFWHTTSETLSSHPPIEEDGVETFATRHLPPPTTATQQEVFRKCSRSPYWG